MSYFVIWLFLYLKLILIIIQRSQYCNLIHNSGTIRKPVLVEYSKFANHRITVLDCRFELTFQIKKPANCSIDGAKFFFGSWEAQVGVFLKFNTMQPSSASVKRPFSSGSAILRHKRLCLASKNFEKLVFIMANFKILKKNQETKSDLIN